MPRVTWFDIPADVPDRAIKFYSKIFDWEFTKWDGPMDYWMAKTGTKEIGIDGGISKRISGQEGISITIDVPSVDEFIKKIIENGGKITCDKMLIPKFGWHAQCMDTEGNKFGIIQKVE